MDRREFLEASTLLTGGALLSGVPVAAADAQPQPPRSDARMIGIQAGAVSFVDEGTERVLDVFEETASINTIFLATFTYGRGIAGRQLPNQPLPRPQRRSPVERESETAMPINAGLADISNGLLLTTLWYIREVDPTTMLLTGLTRDGVYLVEDGAVTAAVNNFRFNESPLDLLRRATQAGLSAPTLPREWGDWVTRTAMPSLRIPDFHMSSVSQAT